MQANQWPFVWKEAGNKCYMSFASGKCQGPKKILVLSKAVHSIVETAYSDHGYSDQLLIWLKKHGTESFLYKRCLNNLVIVIK